MVMSLVDKQHLILYLGAFLGPVGGNAVVTLIPRFRAEFGVDVFTAALSVSLFMAPFVVVQLFTGTASDVYGRRRSAVAGFSIYALGSLICSASPNIELFLTGRIVQGLGFAWINPVVVAMLGDITPEGKRGKTMGLLGSSVTGGITVGLLIGGLVEGRWRLLFVAFAALSLLIALSFMMIFDPSGKEGTVSMSQVLKEMKGPAGSRQVMILCASGFLVFFSYIGIITFLSDALDLPPLEFASWERGVVLSASGLAGIFTSPFAGVVVDKAGRRPTGFVGLLSMAAGITALFAASGFYTYLLSFLVLGAGVAFVWASFNTLAVELVPEKRGTVSSLFNSARFTGYALAPVAMAPIYGGMGMRYVYAAGLLCLLVCSLLVYRIKQR